FAALSGDYNEIHTNEDFASKGPFKTRIAHGLLGLAITSGLKYRTRLLLSTQRNTVGFLGLNWSIRGAIKPGDTIYAKVRVASKRETKDPSRGLVVFKLETLNQRRELVQEAEATFVILRKPAS
ncbi:MAG: MaoC domain protein dehydratase, partial [Dehalococcoidia bacterium]|nr:MaoC domain protein dehydratase [Dehalococcoidia bacterium]